MSHSDSLGLSFLIYKLKRLNNYICTYQHLVSNIQSICKISSCRYGQPNTSGGTRSHFGQVGISGHPFWFFFFFLSRTKGQCSLFYCSEHFQRQILKRFRFLENPCRHFSPPSLLTPLAPQDMDSMAERAEVLPGLLCARDWLPKVLEKVLSTIARHPEHSDNSSFH